MDMNPRLRMLFGRDAVQIRTGGPAKVHDLTFRRNSYETITLRNYWLDDSDAHDLLFLGETHVSLVANGNEVKSDHVLFEDLSINGTPIHHASDGHFVVTGTGVVFLSSHASRRVNPQAP
ncbi:MAG: hypothetical protein HC888_01275 [Candidatus Competibacteraceae bacterium]|nr:hypothetical protein [Candidatus Competibacteraceae bacterium]